MSESIATVRITVLADCPKAWWVCCPKPPPPPVPVRPTGFVPLEEYDVDFTYPRKSSRIPSRNTRGDCLVCGPVSTTPSPDPGPDPDPPPPPAFCWMQSEGQLVLSLPEEFDVSKPVQVYDPYNDYCTTIAHEEMSPYWVNTGDDPSCWDSLQMEEGRTYIFSQGDIMMEMEAGPGNGIIVYWWGIDAGGTLDLEFPTPISFDIDGFTYTGTMYDTNNIEWDISPPMSPPVPTQVTIGVYGEPVTFCGVYFDIPMD